ncbi:MAG: hypothetical protein KF862_03615 [Chitinophagaceae bacterium]|nr:hypothetical protein [Chitinophagaceae bacterium]
MFKRKIQANFTFISILYFQDIMLTVPDDCFDQSAFEKYNITLEVEAKWYKLAV